MEPHLALGTTPVRESRTAPSLDEQSLREVSWRAILRHDNPAFLLVTFGGVLFAFALLIWVTGSSPGGRGRPSRPVPPAEARALVLGTGVLMASLCSLAALRAWRVRRLFRIGARVQASVTKISHAKGYSHLRLDYRHGSREHARPRARARRSARDPGRPRASAQAGPRRALRALMPRTPRRSRCKRSNSACRARKRARSVRNNGAMLRAAFTLALAPFGTHDDPVQAWSDDVMHLVGEIERVHPNPFAGVPREEFEAAIDAFLGGIEGRLAGPNGEEANVVELMRLVALLARGGREGHDLVWSTEFDLLPVQLYRFDDGWFVIDARPGNEALVGKEVTAIACLPIEELAKKVAPLLSRDNEWNLLEKLPHALVTPAILRGLGIQKLVGPVSVSVREGGASHDVALAPIHGGFPREALPPRGELPSARGREKSWWSEVLPESHALYVQYNAVRTADDSGAKLKSFADTLAPLVERQKLERVVLDLRWNGGGDNTTFGPLIDALKDPRIDRPGRFFALIGRQTFSAAGNFTTALDRATGAVFVGEPTGGAPNQYGDARDVTLPNHPALMVRIATRYHVFAAPDDPRLTNEADLRVPWTSSDYFAGRDPVLQRALSEHP
jgi:hypothetical protein